MYVGWTNIFLLLLFLIFFWFFLYTRSGNQLSLSLIGGYKSKEWERNRSAIMEVRTLHQTHASDIDTLYNNWIGLYEEMYNDDDQY